MKHEKREKCYQAVINLDLRKRIIVVCDLLGCVFVFGWASRSSCWIGMFREFGLLFLFGWCVGVLRLAGLS